ncbi:MAG: helix-turn-helix domain-containing protein, partial [Limisphaerales bacterium]
MSLQHSIVALASGGMSRRQIARQLNLDRETVARYLRLAEIDSKPAIVPTGPEGLPQSPPARVPAESARSQPGQPSQCYRPGRGRSESDLRERG